jgi:hypothetical protein
VIVLNAIAIHKYILYIHADLEERVGVPPVGEHEEHQEDVLGRV